MKALEQKQQTPKTLITFVLDETGSMSSMHGAVVSGFKEYVQTMKKQENVTLGLVRFNTDKYTPALYQPIQNYSELTEYKPAAMTNLYDAVARAIRESENMYSFNNGPWTHLFVIMTDGEENSSREYNKAKVMELIKGKQAQGWVFTFMGANQDSWQTGGAMGFSQGNSINFGFTPQGVSQAFYAASNMSANMAMNVSRGTMDKVDIKNLFNAKDVADLDDKLPKQT